MEQFFSEVSQDVAPFVGFSHNVQSPRFKSQCYGWRAEGSEVQSHTGLHSEFKARVGYMRHWLKRKKKNHGAEYILDQEQGMCSLASLLFLLLLPLLLPLLPSSLLLPPLPLDFVLCLWLMSPTLKTGSFLCLLWCFILVVNLSGSEFN